MTDDGSTPSCSDALHRKDSAYLDRDSDGTTLTAVACYSDGSASAPTARTFYTKGADAAELMLLFYWFRSVTISEAMEKGLLDSVYSAMKSDL
eukprot:2697540-Rhodomonas_salina.1